MSAAAVVAGGAAVVAGSGDVLADEVLAVGWSTGDGMCSRLESLAASVPERQAHLRSRSSTAFFSVRAS